MRATLRLGTAAALALVVGLVLSTVFFGSGEGGLLWGLLNEEKRAGALDARREMTGRCLAGKREACAELIAERMTLVEAADRFERLDALLDDGQDEVAGTFRRVSGRSEAIASVMHWVSRTVDDARRAEVLGRLERERDQLVTGAAPITTPPAAPTRRG